MTVITSSAFKSHIYSKITNFQSRYCPRDEDVPERLRAALKQFEVHMQQLIKKLTLYLAFCIILVAESVERNCLLWKQLFFNFLFDKLLQSHCKCGIILFIDEKIMSLLILMVRVPKNLMRDDFRLLESWEKIGWITLVFSEAFNIRFGGGQGWMNPTKLLTEVEGGMHFFVFGDLNLGGE